MKKLFLLASFAAFAAAADTVTNWIYWADGTPGVHVVTNALTEAEIIALIQLHGGGGGGIIGGYVSSVNGETGVVYAATVAQGLKADAAVPRQSGASTNQTLMTATVPTFVSFLTNTVGTLEAGQITWDNNWRTFKLGLGNGVENQVGQEDQKLVKNVWTNTIPNGWAVMRSGAVGNSGKFEIVPAIATAGMSQGRVVGVATEDIAVGALGLVTIRGNVNQIGSNGSLYGSSGWLDMADLYLSHVHQGYLMTNPPPAPYTVVFMGSVINAANNGAIDVSVHCGTSMQDLNDVDGTPLTQSGQFPVYNATTGLFDFTGNTDQFVSKTAPVLYTNSSGVASANGYRVDWLPANSFTKMDAFGFQRYHEDPYGNGDPGEWSSLEISDTVGFQYAVNTQNDLYTGVLGLDSIGVIHMQAVDPFQSRYCCMNINGSISVVDRLQGSDLSWQFNRPGVGGQAVLYPASTGDLLFELDASGLMTTGSVVSGRAQTILTPTNNANLFRIDVEPGANVTGIMMGRPDSVVPPDANGSYLCYIKAPASGTYNHALGLEAGKSNGEVLHLYNKDQVHVARFDTDASEELEVRWSRVTGANQFYWLSGADPYMVISATGGPRVGTSRLTVEGTVSATALTFTNDMTLTSGNYNTTNAIFFTKGTNTWVLRLY